ncbi:MAG: hypothetical protein ACTSXL_01490 [Alphaproteobacteria bacterium]|nr:MAG: hypothetical protein B6I23_02400 [Rickettsiaceae bacterium 4572_127]
MANLNFKDIDGLKIEGGLVKIPLTKRGNTFFFKTKSGKDLDLKKLQGLLKELKVAFNIDSVNNEFQFFEEKIKNAYKTKKLTFSDLVFEKDEKEKDEVVKVLKITKENDFRYCKTKDGKKISFERIKETLNKNGVDFWITEDGNCRFYEKDIKEVSYLKKVDKNYEKAIIKAKLADEAHKIENTKRIAIASLSWMDLGN